MNQKIISKEKSLFENVTILIPTWKNLPYLKKCIESIEKYSSHKPKLLVTIDGYDLETIEWLDSKRIKYVCHKEHKGISDNVNKGVGECETEYVLILHDDLIVSPGYDTNLAPYISEKNVLTMQYIEPGNKPVSPYLIQFDCGKDLETFNEDLFLQKVKEFSRNETSLGVNWSPLINKKLYLSVGGLDPIFNKSTCSDTDLFYKLALEKATFLKIHNSIAYHFQGRSQAKKGEDYSKDEIRSVRDFIRKWGEPFCLDERCLRYTFGSDCKPSVRTTVGNSPKISLCVLTNNDKENIFRILKDYEPLFDEVIFIDDMSSDGSEESISKYISIEKQNSFNFNESKIKFFKRRLDNDFSKQRNFAIDKSTGDWIFFLDSDEFLDRMTFCSLRGFVQNMHEHKDVQVIGFPRINLIDDMRTNVYPDVQWRCMRKGNRWIGKVHEVPEVVFNKEDGKAVVVNELHLVHPKTSKEQLLQNQFYNKIQRELRGGPVKKIFYDSVIWTLEGITGHAKSEILELDKRGYQICIINDLPRNTAFVNNKFMDFYKPWDIEKDDYVTVINQPPVRWLRSSFLKNKIGYLAFEGNLPDDWVKIINESGVLELWTPSEYCKRRFLESGVNKPIYVIPHGVDQNLWNLNKRIEVPKKKKFTFLWAGTIHNSRKGLDLAIKGFCEAFKDNDNVELIVKVNKIYNQGQNVSDYINKYCCEECLPKIKLIEDNLTEEENKELFLRTDVYLSPHRSEGFGMNILQALALGIPTIATGKTGNMDFCNEKNCGLIDTEELPRWAPYKDPVYSNSKWYEPKLESLVNLMKDYYSNYSKKSFDSIEESEKIRKDWSWERTVDKIEERIKSL